MTFEIITKSSRNFFSFSRNFHTSQLKDTAIQCYCCRKNDTDTDIWPRGNLSWSSMCFKIEKFRELETIWWNWNDSPCSFYFFVWKSEKNWVNYLVWLFLRTQKQSVCKSSSNQLTHIRECAMESHTRFRAGLQANSSSTPFMRVKNYVLRNISQCFNCIYLWSFPDLIMIDYLLQHIPVYRLPKKSTLLAVYHVTWILMCTSEWTIEREHKTNCSLSTLWHVWARNKSTNHFLQCMQLVVQCSNNEAVVAFALLFLIKTYCHRSNSLFW